MKQQYSYLIVAFLLMNFLTVSAAERTFNVLFIQSYTSQTPWHDRLNEGLVKGMLDAGVKVNITTEYLDADSWTFSSEKVIMRRFCERARLQNTDLIVTASDEAFYTLFSCGDSLPMKLPIVFFGVKYPDMKLIGSLSNICGYTSNPDYIVMLRKAKQIFPNRKEVICITDDSFLSSKGREDFMNEWKNFVEEAPDYTLEVYNTQKEITNHIITSICNVRNSHGRIVIAPKWSPFLSFIGKNSKSPFFSCQCIAITNGVFGAYDSDGFEVAQKAGESAARILKGASPLSIGVNESEQKFFYDYKQLDFFHVKQERLGSGANVVNAPYWEKYQWLFILLYSSVMILLVAVVVWLVRANRKESRRRVHVQTRLLIQNKLVEQRNEFDNIFHSIRDGVITYDTDYRIHFTNRSLLKMLHLPLEFKARPYEGMPAGSIFKIFHNGKEILLEILQSVAITGKNVTIPEGSFMKEVHSVNYFPVSGEVVPIRSNDQITGMVLSARNISGEEMQKRFFDMAVEESAIYPWQFNLSTGCFNFTQGFLARFGYKESDTIISREDMDQLIHPDDLQEMSISFDKALTGECNMTRLNFRQRNAKGEYEWWEYRTSVLKGMTTNSLYSVFGVCQSIQRYKDTEMELRKARDKALEADKLKSAFLANMSHEIRTPLNSIVGFSDLLSDTRGFSEEVAQFVATINKNCTLLLALINDILDLSRIESGTMDFQFSRHNLPLLLKNIYDSQRLNMKPGVELKLNLPEGDKRYLVTDNVRLQQVINNLINNAAKFTTKGYIMFGFEEDEKPGYIRLFVQDTGVGISETGLKHIFERFYKVDNFTQGAGLGLSICQTIIERLRGTITVTSEIGKGTRFIVRIPDTCD